MAETYTEVLRFGPWSVAIGANELGIQRLTIVRVDQLTPVDGPTLTIPTLTLTSASGTNPPLWDFVMPDLQSGDTIQLDFTSNGSAPDGVAEESQVFDARSEALIWATFTGFPGGSTVRWSMRYGRQVLGVWYWSPWAVAISDIMAPTAFAPSDLFGVGDIGYAWDTTDLSHIWQSNAGTGAGAFASPVGRLDDKSGLGNNWNSDFNTGDRPTLTNTNNGLMTFTAASNTRLKNIGGFRTKGAMTWIGVVKAASSSNFIWAETSTGLTNPVYAPGLRGSNATNMLNYQRNDAATALATSMAAALLDGAIHVYMIEDTGTQLTLWVDGTQTASAAYARNGATTLTNSWLGVADNAGGFFGPMSGSIGSGITISRVLTGALGTVGTEKTKAYNWVAALHGLATL